MPRSSPWTPPTRTIAEADASVAAAQAKTEQIRAAVAARAVALYLKGTAREGGVSALDTTSANDLTTREQYTHLAGQRDRQLQHELTRAREDLAERKTDAEAARSAATSAEGPDRVGAGRPPATATSSSARSSAR